MSSPDIALQRVHAYLNDYRDSPSDSTRYESLDAARSSLLEARRARVSTAHLLPLFTNICAAAIADRSHNVRTVVMQAVEDHCLRDMHIFAPAATPFLMRALHDEHVLVITRAVRALTTLFRKLLGFAVSTGVGTAEGLFQEANLSVWLQMQQKAVSMIHAQDEGLRKASVKFAETVVLALTYSGSAGSPDHFTLDFLFKKGSHSPLLNLTALEEEGIRCVKLIAQLVLTSIDGNLITLRPDRADGVGGLPPASFMTALSVLGNLVRRRRKIIDFTLPPFLGAVAAIIARGNSLTAFQQLSEGQRQSIITVLRFNLLALKAYPHTRTGRVGADITQATNDLANFEREEEIRRKEISAEIAAKERAEAAEAERRRAAATAVPPPSLKRPRSNEPSIPWPRLPPNEAFALSQTIIQGMPPQEVVNFIMTRLLLNIPPVETIPGAQRAIQRLPAANQPGLDEPVAKKPRKSRFATKEPQRPQKESLQPTPAKKVAVVRKHAPPVVPIRLSPAATEKLVIFCCRRILNGERRTRSSGAGPLRIQLLARLLTKLAQQESEIAMKFCEEACSFVVDDIAHNVSLAQAWLFSLICDGEVAILPPAPVMNGRVKDEPAESNCTENDRDVKMTQKPEIELGQPVKPSEEDLSKDQSNNASENNVNMEGAREASGIEKETKAETEKIHIEMENQSSDGHTNGIVEPPTDSDTDGVAKIEGDKSISNQDQNMDVEELVEDDCDPLARNAPYERIFIKILELILEKHPDKSDAYSDFLIDAPVLPEAAIKTIKGFCEDPSRLKLGLYTLRDIVLKRPGNDRWTALSFLLNFTQHEDEVLSGPAIRLVANKIFVECAGEVPEAIEKHAIESLQKAIEELPESAKHDEVNHLERGSLLLTALCGQKPELLTKVAFAYSTAPQRAKKVLLSRSKDLAGHLGMSADPVIKLISGKLLRAELNRGDENIATDGLEELALEMLKAILKKFGKPSEELVEAAQQRYERSGDINFIIAVLSGLRKEALLKYLAPIVNVAHSIGEPKTETEKSNGVADSANTACFKDIVTTIMSNRSPALSPAELLIELHNIDPSSAVGSAVRACFELKAIYKQESIAQALQQLIEKTVVPDLFMRTVHLARIYYPELEKYLTGTVMMRLVEKQVWKNEVVWEGYLRFCAELKEKSLKILLSLPVSQLGDALERQEALRGVFRELFANPKNLKKVKIQVKHRKVIQAALKNHSDSAS